MTSLYKKILISSVTLTTCLFLQGCEKTKAQFDFSKKAPDEFSVVTRAPLEMPQDVSTLPTPRPGAQRPQEISAEQQAQQALFGQTAAGQGVTLSQGESILLEKTGAAQQSATIRQTVDAEAQETIKENTSTYNRIMGKLGKKSDAPASVVDPVKEHERLQTNKQQNKPVTTGETPIREE